MNFQIYFLMASDYMNCGTVLKILIENERIPSEIYIVFRE